MNPALFSSAKEDWETPREFFERLDGEFHFDLDVCAFPHNAKCLAYFTKEDDGLARDWGKHTCWMNPPYGKDIKAWMTKALDASRRGATVVCLVPSRTDTAWWHDTVIAGGAGSPLRPGQGSGSSGPSIRALPVGGGDFQAAAVAITAKGNER